MIGRVFRKRGFGAVGSGSKKCREPKKGERDLKSEARKRESEAQKREARKRESEARKREGAKVFLRGQQDKASAATFAWTGR